MRRLPATAGPACSPITTSADVLADADAAPAPRANRRGTPGSAARSGPASARGSTGRSADSPGERLEHRIGRRALLPARASRSGRGGAVAAASSVRSRTVDSRPTAVGPLSMIRSIRPSRSARTCSARVGESRFDRFALGAAIGWPDAFDQAASDRPGGAPHARRSSLPAVTMSGMMADAVEDERQRAGPEPRGQRLGRRRAIRATHVAGLRDTGHVDDQRVDRGPSLGREDPRDGRGVGGDRPQAVDRLGRERDQPAAASRSAPPRRARPDRARRGRRRGREWRAGVTRDIGSVGRRRIAARQEALRADATRRLAFGSQPGLILRPERLVVAWSAAR